MADGQERVAAYALRLRWERFKLAVSETWLGLRGVKGDVPPDPESVFALLSQRDLSTVHHALRMLAKFQSEKDEATRLADAAWAVNCERSEARHVAG